MNIKTYFIWFVLSKNISISIKQKWVSLDANIYVVCWSFMSQYDKIALHKNVLCKISTLHNEGFSENCMSQNAVAAICK